MVFGPGVTVEDGAVIRAFSHLEGARVGKGARVGPFARLRPGASSATDAHIGNFVEVKNGEIEAGAKANHLAYIGDARVGAGANIGAGTITCNYDGFDKYETDIGEGAFIGSNTSLVAPVKIGDGAYIGSGIGDHDGCAGRRAGDRPWAAEREGRLGEAAARPANGSSRKRRSGVNQPRRDRRFCHNTKSDCDFDVLAAASYILKQNFDMCGVVGRGCAVSSGSWAADAGGAASSSMRSSASNTAAMIPPASRRSMADG